MGDTIFQIAKQTTSFLKLNRNQLESTPHEFHISCGSGNKHSGSIKGKEYLD